MSIKKIKYSVEFIRELLYFRYDILFVNGLYSTFVDRIECFIRQDGWMDGCRFESNCPLLGPGTID